MSNENLQLLDCLFHLCFFFILAVPVGLGSPFATSLYKRHFADEDLSIPELSSRNKRNRRKLYYNLQKVWDSSDSLNGNSCSLFIFIRSTIPMISGDFLTRCNAITVRKGREKGLIFRYFIFLDRSFGSQLPYEGTTFIPNLSS